MPAVGAHKLLESITYVFDQVEAVGDLEGLGSTSAASKSISV